MAFGVLCLPARPLVGPRPASTGDPETPMENPGLPLLSFVSPTIPLWDSAWKGKDGIRLVI